MAARRIAVAYSGGRDSTALLHATLAAAASVVDTGEAVEVVALHVHHGLRPDADAWAEHCRRQCDAWSVGGGRLQFGLDRLAGRPPAGASIEAWARDARYAALGRMALAAGCRAVLLAHHRRDQAETFVLQALRGAGPAGLAAMARVALRGGIEWHRPWLHRPRADIEAYVALHRLQHLDDPSNADPRHARSRLRTAVWPALVAAFEHAEATLATAASHAAEATAALDELAAIDLAACADATGLRVDAWVALSAARRGNALRAWLRHEAGERRPATLIERLQRELPTAVSARWPMPGGELRLHRNRLVAMRCRKTPVESAVRLASIAITGCGDHPLPGWGGVLHVEPDPARGIPLALLGAVELRERTGDDRFQAGCGRPPRSLKRQYQAAGVPAWERGGPLVHAAGGLVYVPGLGLDARACGLAGTPRVGLRWLPDRVRERLPESLSDAVAPADRTAPPAG